MNIYHLVSNKEWGGGEQYVLNLGNRQREEGHYVEIVSRRSQEVLSRFNREEFPISTLPLKGLTDIDSAMRLGRMIRNHKDVVIHAHNFKDAYTACLARKFSENPDVKVIVTRHLVKRAKRGMLHNTLYKDIDAVIFVSQLARDAFLSSRPKINRNKVHVVLNSVIQHPGPGIDIRAKFGIRSDKTVISYHGRLAREKGVDVLLKALSQLPQEKYHAVLFGRGEQEFTEHLKNIITANGLEQNISFAGFVEDPQQYIRTADIGVVPSVAAESSSLSTMEYMMWGVPVIASSNGAQREFITPGKTGFLVSENNPYALASELIALIDNPELRSTVGDAGQKKFNEMLSFEKFYQGVKNVYTEVWK